MSVGEKHNYYTCTGIFPACTHTLFLTHTQTEGRGHTPVHRLREVVLPFYADVWIPLAKNPSVLLKHPLVPSGNAAERGVTAHAKDLILMWLMYFHLLHTQQVKYPQTTCFSSLYMLQYCHRHFTPASAPCTIQDYSGQQVQGQLTHITEQ